MDIWNTHNPSAATTSSHHNNNGNGHGSNNGSGNHTQLSDTLSAYDPLATFNATLSNPTDYKQSFSNVELDPLAFQMMQLNTKDPLSQMTTPSMMQNSYFGNSSLPLNNRQLSDNTISKLTGQNANGNSNGNGNGNGGNNFNSNWSNNNTVNTLNTNNTNNNNNNNTNTNNSNTNANASSNNNNNPYTNYLIQQAQQAQQQSAPVLSQSLSQPASHHNSFSAQMNYKRSQSNAQQSHQSAAQFQSQNRSNPPNYNHQQQSHNNNSITNSNINSFQNENIKPQNQFHMDSRALKPSNQFKNSMNITDPSEIETFKGKLQLKDVIINKLESELEKMKQFQNTILKAQNDSNGNYEIPKNYEELYLKLVEKIQATESELDDTKTRLEALVTAIAMNPNPSTFKNGRYDEEEISHKIISKLKMLTEENEELSRMVSYGKSKEKDIEIALLRKQNNDLLEKVAKLEGKLNDKK